MNDRLAELILAVEDDLSSGLLYTHIRFNDNTKKVLERVSCSREIPQNLTVYTDLLVVGDDDIPFSTHGDSGSLIVTNDEQLNPIGLLWGGWQEKLRTGHAQDNWTYGIALISSTGFTGNRHRFQSIEAGFSQYA